MPQRKDDQAPQEHRHQKHEDGGTLHWLAETLWLRSDLREQVGSAARLIEKGVVCWLHVLRVLLLARPIRMFGE